MPSSAMNAFGRGPTGHYVAIEKFVLARCSVGDRFTRLRTQSYWLCLPRQCPWYFGHGILGRKLRELHGNHTHSDPRVRLTCGEILPDGAIKGFHLHRLKILMSHNPGGKRRIDRPVLQLISPIRIGTNLSGNGSSTRL